MIDIIKELPNLSEIRELFNKKHKKNGYSRSTLGRYLCWEYGFEEKTKFKHGFFDPDNSTIEVNGHLFTFSDFAKYLLFHNIIEQKLIEVDTTSGEKQRIRRFFTTDYVGYQKNKKRKMVIDKVLSNVK